MSFTKKRGALPTERLLMGQGGTCVPCGCSFSLLHSIPQQIRPAALTLLEGGAKQTAQQGPVISEGSQQLCSQARPDGRLAPEARPTHLAYYSILQVGSLGPAGFLTLSRPVLTKRRDILGSDA